MSLVMATNDNAPLTTLDVALRCGVSPQTVRVWERTGKLPAAQKTRSGQRLFSREAVEQHARHREHPETGR